MVIGRVTDHLLVLNTVEKDVQLARTLFHRTFKEPRHCFWTSEGVYYHVNPSITLRPFPFLADFESGSWWFEPYSSYKMSRGVNTYKGREATFFFVTKICVIFMFKS